MRDKLKKINDFCWEIPKHGNMRVKAVFFGSLEIIGGLEDRVFEQAVNVATLPGIVKASLVMPDGHWGYGFPIGGVAAFDPDKGGVISVGGIGYDISCGVRTIATGLDKKEVIPFLEDLIDELFENIPVGLGSEGFIKLSEKKLDEVLIRGAIWAVERGYGSKEDLEFIEDGGCVKGADPSKVSSEAKKRQKRQVGTLGSGNHYLELQYVDEIYDQKAAKVLGLNKDEVVISIHCGSRALGHQIGTDYLQVLARASEKYKINLPDRELVCAPIYSKEGQDFYKAMVCGINCALANRQVVGHLASEIFYKFFPHAKIRLIYDISHNTCKIEKHEVNGKVKELYVHRKGATRAFGPGRKEIPDRYKEIGQPVIIGGTMGTASYILVGSDKSEELAWSSACHGAGRSLSRRQAKKRWTGKEIIEGLEKRGILVRAASKRGAAEEAPEAYKDVNLVVESTHQAGLAKKVVRLKPLACIKG